METDSDSEIPKKVVRKAGPTVECIICNEQGPKDDLYGPKSEESWKTLLAAATVHQCQSLLQYKDYTGIPSIYYHSECRKKFCHKKTLARLKAGQSPSCSTSEGSETSQIRRSREKTDSGRVYEKICIFCDKKSKYKKGTNTRETLTQAVDLRADATVRNVATSKGDTKLLAIVSREIVAAEAHYHRSCYKNYTRQDETASTSQAERGDDEQNIKEYSEIETEAFSELFDFVRNDIFLNPRVMPMTALTDRLVRTMGAKGVESIRKSTKKHIRRKLETEFGNSIEFMTDSSNKLHVIPDNLSKASLIRKNLELSSQLQAFKSKDLSDKVKTCALEIRKVVRESTVEQEWPPAPESLKSDYVTIPECLSDFLYALIGRESNTPQQSHKTDRLVNSIAQDCIHAITAGRQKPAKHILLPWVVKTLTGNVELIKILNRLGHGISYTQLEEIDTALCLQKIAACDKDDVPLPSNILPCVPTTLAFVNIDRLDETLTGAGTSHRVNGIIVQPDVPTVLKPKEHTTVEKVRSRSISPSTTLIPPYISGKKGRPPTLKDSIDLNSSDEVNIAKRKNQIWSLLRQNDTEDQKIPSWTGFNIQTRSAVEINQDKLGYLPTINAPATDLSTVNEILNQAMRIAKMLELKEIVCVFDQALYAKVTEILWKDEEKMQTIIARMGAFHTILNFIGTIGKRFKDAGLRDMAVESGVIAEGSIESVLEGRQYNRGVRLHKIIYEALQRLIWKGFYSWLEVEHSEDLTKLLEMQHETEKLHSCLTQDQFEQFFKNESCIRILELFDKYQDILRNEKGELSSFWMTYTDMIEILLGLIRASREGNWILHLAMIRKVIPWMFAYDRLNYARYLPVYYMQMTTLPTTNPELHKHLTQGAMSVQLGAANTFGRIPVDQAIEETANKDTQTAGGTKGFSLKPGAVSRYYLTAEYRSVCLKNLREMVHEKPPGVSHVDLEPGRITKDEKSIQAVVDILESSWINPFATSSDLISLSTASAASSEIRNDLMNAQEKGEQAYDEFRKTRLAENSTKDFYDRQSKLQLKTFSDLRKSRKTKVPEKEVVLKADHRLFGNMVLVATSRNLDMREVLKHPLGPLPWSLANSDGTLKKTNKSALARNIEDRGSSAENVPSPSACIIDAMSFLNKLNGDNRTFGEIAENIFMYALQTGTSSNRIDIVFDVYKDNSIKNAERENRGEETGLVYGNIVAGQRIQQWKKLLRSSGSKTALIHFLCETWKSPPYPEKLGSKELLITCQTKCFKVTKDGTTDVDDLSTSQEEADTRMLLHAKHASADYSAMIIVSEDTDVFIMSLAVYRQLTGKLFIRCGTKNRLRHIDVSKIGQSLGDDCCRALPGLHAFTGCDSVSAFGGRGKVGALKLIMKGGRMQSAMEGLGENWILSPELFLLLQEFVCKMYMSQTTLTQVNDLRYQLFRVKKGDVDSSQLPPCQDCLYLHAQRANYQACIWNRCLEQEPEVPNPEGYGWMIEDGRLIIDWMQGLPAPQVVMELIACKCNRVCKAPECQCIVNALKCSPACKNQFCDNMVADEDEEGDDESSDESDEGEDNG